jgi:hypothetical protein
MCDVTGVDVVVHTLATLKVFDWEGKVETACSYCYGNGKPGLDFI